MAVTAITVTAIFMTRAGRCRQSIISNGTNTMHPKIITIQKFEKNAGLSYDAEIVFVMDGGLTRTEKLTDTLNGRLTRLIGTWDHAKWIGARLALYPKRRPKGGFDERLGRSVAA
jgi:hypothetical protein